MLLTQDTQRHIKNSSECSKSSKSSCIVMNHMTNTFWTGRSVHYKELWKNSPIITHEPMTLSRSSVWCQRNPVVNSKKTSAFIHKWRSEDNSALCKHALRYCVFLHCVQWNSLRSSLRDPVLWWVKTKRSSFRLCSVDCCSSPTTRGESGVQVFRWRVTTEKERETVSKSTWYAVIALTFNNH